MIGESIITLPREEAIEKVEAMNDNVSNECKIITDKIGTIKDELAKLKVILYAKFKNSINLEED